jgi:outer membrane protein
MRKAEDDAKKRLLKELGDVVDDIGKKGNFTLIFEKRSGGIMYFNNTLDVTDEVIAAYDRTKK